MKRVAILFFLTTLIVSCSNFSNVKPKQVCITIDDAPGFPVNTKKMLEVLKKHDVQATFFCVGQQIDNDTLHLADTIAKYHTLANHTYTHPKLGDIGLKNNYNNEVLKTQTIIDSINSKYNKANRYFRFPYSNSSKKQQDTLASYNYEIIRWNSDASDWDTSISVDEIFKTHVNSINKSKGTTTLIFHLSENSVIALDSLLDYLKKMDIKVVNLDKR